MLRFQVKQSWPKLTPVFPSATRLGLVAESQRTPVRKAFDDANNGAESDDAEETLVLDDLEDVILCLLGLGLEVHTFFLHVLGGGLDGFEVALGGCLRVEGVAVEEVLILLVPSITEPLNLHRRWGPKAR
jgi:hypothetical protein